ncbi:hypothetical protein IM774_12165 [Erysipelotrichaceae bacterium RD49]|nr:hypothetical protein [Erysipelotrichaceae bacterium RD49]
MSILKLAPAAIVNETDAKAINELINTDEPLAADSTYVFSQNPGYGNVVVSGPQAGIYFNQWLSDYGYDALGSDGKKYGRLPFEIRGLGGEEGKLYYSKNKTKPSLWVITDVKPGGMLYLAPADEIDQNTFIDKLKDGTFVDSFEEVEVAPQTLADLDAGSAYVLNSGVRVLEITPTVDMPEDHHDHDHHDHDHDHEAEVRPVSHDYHKGDAVIDGSASYSVGETNSLYEADFYLLDGSMEMDADSHSFKVLVFISGTAVVDDHEETVHAQKGTVIFVPASTKPFRITGNCNFMVVHLND